MKTIFKTTFLVGFSILGVHLSTNAQTYGTGGNGNIQGLRTGTIPFSIFSGYNQYDGSYIDLHSNGNPNKSINYITGYGGFHEFSTRDGSGNYKVRMKISDTGIGIGTTNPAPSGIHLADPQDWGVSLWLDASSKGGSFWGLQSAANYHGAGAGNFAIHDQNQSKDYLIIQGGSDLNWQGLVKIPKRLLVGVQSPTTHADYKVAVDGKLVAKSLYITAPTAWADYVFDNDYKLTPLSEVESFIKENKHLPEVPSTVEVMENGIDVASMDALLLKKIEELTLHMIELEKKNKNLEEQIQLIRSK